MDDATRMRYHDAFGRTGLGSVASAALAELIRVGGGPSPIIAARLAARMGVSSPRVEAALRQLITRNMIGRVGRDYQILDTAGWPIILLPGRLGIGLDNLKRADKIRRAALALPGDR